MPGASRALPKEALRAERSRSGKKDPRLVPAEAGVEDFSEIPEFPEDFPEDFPELPDFARFAEAASFGEAWEVGLAAE